MAIAIPPQEVFKELLKHLAPTMKQHAFRRRGQTFFRREAGGSGNWGIVNFQKSTSSTARQVRFTINLGIFSERIGRPAWATSGWPPSIWDCHFRQRIGHLMPVRNDHWWTIDATTPFDPLVNEIGNLMTSVAVPEIDIYIRDESLRDLWLSGRSPGEGDLQRLRFLAVLLKALGPDEHLGPTLARLAEYGD